MLLTMNANVWTKRLSLCNKHSLNVWIRCLSDKSEKQNQKLVTKCLKNSFGLQLPQIETIYQNYPNVKSLDVKSLQNICSLLERKELCFEEMATKRTWILMTDKLSLKTGLKCLERYGLINDIINGKSYYLSLFLVQRQRFEALCKRIRKSVTMYSDFDRRCDYFCTHLEINCQTFCSLVSRNSQLIQIDFERIEQIMCLLKDNSICNEDIINDLWIFNHNFDVMKERTQECNESGYPIRTWVLRCPSDIWYPLLERYRQNNNVLDKYSDKTEFLMNKLSLNESQMKALLNKYPHLMTIKPKKLDQNITLLYELGYNSSDILNCPRVLGYSFDRINKRLKGNRIHKMIKVDLNIILLPEKSFKSLPKNSYFPL